MAYATEEYLYFRSITTTARQPFLLPPPLDERGQEKHNQTSMYKVTSVMDGVAKIRFIEDYRELEEVLNNLLKVNGLAVTVRDNRSSHRIKNDYGKLRLDKDRKQWI